MATSLAAGPVGAVSIVHNGVVHARCEESQPDDRFHVSVVCTGNICRSPMAAIVLRKALDDAGLSDRVVVTSAGTGPWFEGGPAHEATRRVLAREGFPTHHVAHQITRQEMPLIDLVLAADRGHLSALHTLDRPIRSSGERIALFRSFDPTADHDEIPDPYGGPDSEYVEVMAMVRAAVPGIVDEIRRRIE